MSGVPGARAITARASSFGDEKPGTPEQLCSQAPGRFGVTRDDRRSRRRSRPRRLGGADDVGDGQHGLDRGAGEPEDIHLAPPRGI